MVTRREFLAAAAFAAGKPELSLTDTPGDKVTVKQGAVTLLEYRYSPALPKSYIHPLCLPDGRVLTLDSPPDHVHHRGLMVAWSAVNGIDFWGETNPGRHGTIVHQRFEGQVQSAGGQLVSVNHWLAEGKHLLTERRTIRVAAPGEEGLWLDWITELTPASDPVRVAAGEHVYNGLGIRFIHEMDGGEVLNANGAATIEKANGGNAPWCFYKKGEAGVALFDHPSNPHHPNPFFVMNQPFGYLSAAPTFRESFDLAAGRTLRFHWGVLAFPTVPSGAVLQHRFQSWTREKS